MLIGTRALFVSLAVSIALASDPDGAGLQPGVMPVSFKTGGPNCATLADWEIHAYNDDFYILRESGCIDAEKPFLYLIFGDQKALLEDTGVGKVQVAPIVTDLIAKWANTKNHPPVSLVVIHSHGHGDHTAGDPQFHALAGVQFIAAKPEEVSKAAGITNWPEGLGKIDL